MMDFLKALVDNHQIIGDWDAEKVSHLTPEWFYERWIDLLDFRGDLRFSADNVVLGRKVTIITASHDVSTGCPLAGAVLRKVWIDGHCYIGSRSILYNCHIKHHAVVACGSVVRNIVVEPYTIVEGNPAKVVSKFEEGKWVRINEEFTPIIR